MSCGIVRVFLLFLETICELGLVADFNYQYLIHYMHEGEYAYFIFPPPSLLFFYIIHADIHTEDLFSDMCIFKKTKLPIKILHS